MSRKHPLVAAIEKRIEERKIEMSNLDTQMFQLKDRLEALKGLQEEDVKLLADSAPKTPRTKKVTKGTKDGGKSLESVGA